MQRFYEESYGSVARGVHQLSAEATRQYEAARARVGAFLGAASPDEVVFVRGTTEAANLVAWSFARPRLSPGDEILVTELEHHSNLVPWQMVCEERGAHLVVVPVDDCGEVDPDEFSQRLGPKTKLAAFAHVSNALGTVLPVAELVASRAPRGRAGVRRRRAVGAPSRSRRRGARTATSSPSPATRSTARRESARSTAGKSSWTRCRPGRAAAG